MGVREGKRWLKRAKQRFKKANLELKWGRLELKWAQQKPNGAQSTLELCRLIINRLSTEYMFSLIMVKYLVAIRDLEYAFCSFSPQSYCLLSPRRLDVFYPCPYKTMNHRSFDRGHVLTEQNAPTDQSERVSFDYRTKFISVRVKSLRQS